jgi:release factor glutamine methyltransferase
LKDFKLEALNALIKYLIRNTYQPALVKYLSTTRTYIFRDIVLQVPKEVFHPGFFFSTQLLLHHLAGHILQNKRLLELGAGSGLISIFAAKRGASVLASDINPVAIDYLSVNARENRVSLDIVHSDLFDSIPLEPFDIIAINPPYYKKNPQKHLEYAWFCGERGEYFEKLFSRLGEFTHAHSLVFMVLCDACDFSMIEQMAAKAGFRWECVFEKKNLIERNFIYSIIKQ